MKYLIAVFLLALLTGCKQDRPPRDTVQMPADSIIPEPQMILLLADAHTIEAALLIDRNRGINTSEMADFYYNGLFRKYRISRERYDQNLIYYREDPAALIKMYEKVNAVLAEREKDFVSPSHH